MRKAKFALSALLSSSMLVSSAMPIHAARLSSAVSKDITVTIDGQERTFKDVDPTMWYAPVIAEAAEKGIMTGLTDDTFGPNETMTRAMAATVLYRLAGQPPVESKVSETFSDVKDDLWYSDAIQWCYENGVVFGYEGELEGKFGPNDLVTREQMAVMIVRDLARQGNDVDSVTSLDDFLDVEDVDPFAVEAMKFCVEKGIFEGAEDGTKLLPRNNATRAESAKINLVGSKTKGDAQYKAQVERELAADGYTEVGKYKIENIKDNIYHLDEGTKELPGGATDYSGNMNNPSSIYLVVGDEEVLIIDAGNPASKAADVDAISNLLEAMCGEKKVTMIFTHSHGDHTGLMRNPAVFANIHLDKLYIHENDYESGSGALEAFLPITETVKDGDIVTVDGVDYVISDMAGHTAGSIVIYSNEKEVVFSGDSMGSGFVWLFWQTNDNPIGTMEAGLNNMTSVISNMDSPTILAGHRWQQFWEENPQRPNEMSIQYLNDMLKVISGIKDGSVKKEEYAQRGAEGDLELSSVGCKAKVDTTQEIIDMYLEAENAKSLPYGWQITKSNTLDIDSENTQNPPIFMIYPDKAMDQEEAEALMADLGIEDIVTKSASKAIVMNPVEGDTWSDGDVQHFMDYLDEIIYVATNLKLIGIGDGATFINQKLNNNNWMISSMLLYGGQAGEAGKYAVPVALADTNQAVADQYAAMDGIDETIDISKDGTYNNPDNRFEEVSIIAGDVTLKEAFAQAWKSTLGHYSRIGNYTDEEDAIGTWYSTPLTKEREFQFFESISTIDNMNVSVVTEDLNGSGDLSLWYEYVPAEKVNAEAGSVPVVLLMHGNTNDPRTQYDTSGWAQVASQEGIILICPEWQGHTFQGYTYEAISNTAAEGEEISDLEKMINIIKEKYPQIDASRIYISGLSAGSRQTLQDGLKLPNIFASGAGQSGAWGCSDEDKELAASKADQYDFPIIFFGGDKDEYLVNSWDTLESTGGLTTLQGYQILNNIPETSVDDLKEEFIELYGVPWPEYGTVDNEGICEIIGGTFTNDKGVKISLNRIKGWGHWNYPADAALMWDFMKGYARDLETGASIVLE